jgi:hypothetical protein
MFDNEGFMQINSAKNYPKLTIPNKIMDKLEEIMDNKKILENLYKIGKLPTEEIADKIGFPLEKFDKLLQKFNTPIDYETALKLIYLSPPVDEGCYEMEWAIIHIVETYANNDECTDEKYKKLLDEAEEGEIKNILKIRFENYLNKK